MNKNDNATLRADTSTSAQTVSNVIHAEHRFKKPEPAGEIRIAAIHPGRYTVAAVGLPMSRAGDALMALEDARIAIKHGFVSAAKVDLRGAQAAVTLNVNPEGELNLTIAGQVGLYAAELLCGIGRLEHELAKQIPRAASR